MKNANPDSLLTAAKKLADIANLPWAEVQPIYRALQEEDETLTAWLPKSQGRSIFLANPNYIARLLIALGSFADSKDAHKVVSQAQELTPNGREKFISEWPSSGVRSPIEEMFRRFLTDPEEADKLQNIEFHTDAGRIVFRWKDDSEVWFLPQTPQPIECTKSIMKRGFMTGSLFRLLSREIAWQHGPCPVDASGTTTGEDE